MLLSVVPNVLFIVLFGTMRFANLLVLSILRFCSVPNVLFIVLFGTMCFANLLVLSILRFCSVPNVLFIVLVLSWNGVTGYRTISC